jgi:RNA polymerase sigma-70 factor (ECF subfamily)
VVELDDAALVAGLRAGDEAAAEALVREYGGRLLSVARRLLGSEEDSEDAVQEAFLAAFESLDSFAGGSAISTWLHRIVVNACLMKLRKRAVRYTVPLDDLLPSFDAAGRHASRITAWDTTALDRLTEEETRSFVRRSIDRLPEPHRTVILLRDIEELSTEDTAQVLGISPGAVKVRLHRARQALRTLLETRLGADVGRN